MTKLPKAAPKSAALPFRQTGRTTRISPPARPISFCAVPDNGEIGVRIMADGKPTALLPNRLAVPKELRAELELTTDELWYPRPPAPNPPAVPWIVNHCADADEYRNGLIWLDETFGASVPIFNHPRAIARSRRDHSAAALQGIAGLKVPRCVRLQAKSRAAFEQCFNENGFRFPVLVRPSGEQTGRGLIKIEGPKDWDRAVNTPWFGKPHFMTEFVDFATEDGLYLKARVLFVADRFFIRHVKGATGWKVHNDSSNSILDFKTRELELIEILNQNADFARICADVPSRTGLDFCGMDMGVDPERNRFVMFECNAAMSVFFKSAGRVDAERQARRDLLETPASSAFEAHLRARDAWVWRNSPLSQDGASPSCRTMLTD
jgi:glutathione synthase/RimK-type ligase-like ATP-grasp enzyme